MKAGEGNLWKTKLNSQSIRGKNSWLEKALILISLQQTNIIKIQYGKLNI